jgi:hypothetical protein
MSTCKVEASKFDHVHFTAHEGHAMPTWMRPIYFKRTTLKFVVLVACGRFTLIKSFDNRRGQGVALATITPCNIIQIHNNVKWDGLTLFHGIVYTFRLNVKTVM